MFANPFTPIFGGKPDFFFGRKEILARFRRALVLHGSEDRTLFITGARGSGKTALVEQLSRRALAAGWDVIDLNADHALQSLFRQIQEYDVSSSTVDPKLELKILGSGGSLSGRSTTKTAHYGVDDVDVLFRRACERASKGFFVSIDEMQKVPLDDVSKICGAFQMASRKGFDVILVVAGLPYSFEPAIQHDGCTYLRRSVHEELGLFPADDVVEAFREAFDRIEGLDLEDSALDRLVGYSSGHPYMIQLLGFHLVESINESTISTHYRVSTDDVEEVLPIVMDAYERRALRPILDALPPESLAYLVAMVKTMDETHVSSTGAISKELEKTHQQLSSTRKALIDEGIIVSCGYGKVRFAIPYLRRYLATSSIDVSSGDLLELWDV